MDKIVWIKSATHGLKKRGLLISFEDISNFQNNNFHVYKAQLRNNIVSFAHSTDRINTQLKCIGEALERIAFRIQPKIYLTDSYNKRNKYRYKFLNLSLYSNNFSNVPMKWIEGYDLYSRKPVLIPSDLICYQLNKSGSLSPSGNIGSGTAGEISRTKAIVNGIYELVERDCFMNITAFKIKVPRVDLSQCENKQIIHLLKISQENKIDLRVYDITNDLSLPTYLCVITSRNKITFFSSGIKTNLNSDNAVIGAIEEAIGESLIKNLNVSKMNPAYGQGNKAKFFYLYNQKPQKVKWFHKEYSTKQTLEILLSIFASKHFHCYCTDITPFWYKTLEYHVYRIIIPELQPYYFYPEYMEIRKKRLLTSLIYFQKKYG